MDTVRIMHNVLVLFYQGFFSGLGEGAFSLLKGELYAAKIEEGNERSRSNFEIWGKLHDF